MIYDSEKLKKLGKNIAKFRKARHLSQFQFAEMLNISREHLAKIETAKRGISMSLLFNLSETLNIPEKDFFDFE